MPGPFVFRKVMYLVEASGRRAATLDELLRLLTVAEPDAIGFHMHREFLAYKFAHAEYTNDFATWAAHDLGDDVLAERLANLRAFRHAHLSDLGREVAAVVADHVIRFPDAARVRVPPGREFNLCTARKFVLPTGRVAADLPQFTAAIAEVEASSLFYHLFETHYDRDNPERPGDFSTWASSSLRRPDLGRRLEGFDPYMFSLEQARALLLRILTEAA